MSIGQVGMSRQNVSFGARGINQERAGKMVYNASGKAANEARKIQREIANAINGPSGAKPVYSNYMDKMPGQQAVYA